MMFYILFIWKQVFEKKSIPWPVVWADMKNISRRNLRRCKTQLFFYIKYKLVKTKKNREEAVI